MSHINMLAEDIRLMQVKSNMGKTHPCCSLFLLLESLSALLEPSVHLVSCHSLVPMSRSLQKMVSWSGEATPGHRERVSMRALGLAGSSTWPGMHLHKCFISLKPSSSIIWKLFKSPLSSAVIPRTDRSAAM